MRHLITFQRNLAQSSAIQRNLAQSSAFQRKSTPFSVIMSFKCNTSSLCAINLYDLLFIVIDLLLYYNTIKSLMNTYCSYISQSLVNFHKYCPHYHKILHCYVRVLSHDVYFQRCFPLSHHRRSHRSFSSSD